MLQEIPDSDFIIRIGKYGAIGFISVIRNSFGTGIVDKSITIPKEFKAAYKIAFSNYSAKTIADLVLFDTTLQVYAEKGWVVINGFYPLE